MRFRVQLNRFRTNFKLHTPEILLVSGMVEGAVGTVLACMATKKAVENKPIDILGEEKEKTFKEKVALVIDSCKTYAPAAGFMVAGAVSICASHGIMRKRYAGLLTSYAALTTSFMEYRGRVKEEIGEKREEELYYGTEKESISVEITDKDGKKRKVNKKLDVQRRTGLSPYARKLDLEKVFGRDAADPVYVDSMLVTKENNLNDILKAYGHLYLNSAYRAYYLEEDDAGQLVGWIYDPDRVKEGNGDNQIRVIKKVIRVPREDGGFDVETWLDFNVDGVILGLMSREEYNTHINEAGNQGIEFSNKEE